jgi:hypothetical protein
MSDATRWALFARLKQTGLPIETGSGGRTKYNRTRLNLDKSHWADAACVGESTPNTLRADQVRPLLIVAKGHGSRQMCRIDQYGFPIRYVPRQKHWFGFRTGDLVKAVVPNGKYAGVHIGRITIRSRPSFRLNGVDVHPKYLRMLQGADGYAYSFEAARN